MVLVQLTLWKSCIQLCKKVKYTLFLENAKWDLDVGKILFTSSFIKHEQIDFSLLVNGKSIESKAFPSIIISDTFVFNLNPKWKGCYKLFFFHITMSKGMGKGSNKVLYKEALAQGQNLICFWQERLPFHMDVASSLKILSQNLLWPH